MQPESFTIQPRSGLRYDQLHAPVRTYVDNLRAQVYEVLGKYGVTNMTEFIAKMKKVEVPDREKVIKLMGAIEMAYKKNETPDEQVILAEDKDGNELRFDLHEIHEQWKKFYTDHNLKEVADLLPSQIELTPEQIETLKTKAKEGYTRAILVPAGIENHLAKLKKNLADGFEKDDQGIPIETWLDNKLIPSFPNKIETTDPNRRGKAYLLLTNPNEPLLPGSKGKTADKLIQEFQAKGLTGLTLADYFIEERQHFEATGQHLVDWSRHEWTWLLSSMDRASRVLRAGWSQAGRHVGLRSAYSDDSYRDLGARASVVLSLETLP